MWRRFLSAHVRKSSYTRHPNDSVFTIHPPEHSPGGSQVFVLEHLHVFSPVADSPFYSGMAGKPAGFQIKTQEFRSTQKIALEKFKFLEKIAIADVAFEAYGNTLEELFESSAQAVFEAMVSLETVEEKETEKIELESVKIEDLLFDWLSELVYLKDAKATLFKNFKVRIQDNKKYRLKAEAKGEKIDRNKHHLRVDVKAVTYHMLEVKREEGKWTAQVILDI